MGREPRWDAIVVGAGPAGSATALRLARSGQRVLLLDRARFPRDKACSEYASPEAVRQLDALGVLATVEAHGTTALTGSSVTGALGGGIAGRFDAAGGHPSAPPAWRCRACCSMPHSCRPRVTAA